MHTIDTHVHEEGLRALREAHDSLCILWHDDRIGDTHAPVLGGEHQEPLHRANLETALDILAEHVEAGDVEDGTVGRSGATWVTFLLVRVLDDDGGIHPAWVDAYEQVIAPLEDYPVLDEERFSELEHEELYEQVAYWACDDEVTEAVLSHPEAPGHPEGFTPDHWGYVLAADVWDGHLDLSEDARDRVADLARDTARHYQYDGHSRFGHPTRRARRLARGIVAEILADRLEVPA